MPGIYLPADPEQPDWAGKVVSKTIEQWVEALEMRRLRIGDSVSLPGGRSLTLTDRHISDDKMMITWDNNPVPFILVKRDTSWLVEHLDERPNRAEVSQLDQRDRGMFSNRWPRIS